LPTGKRAGRGGTGFDKKAEGTDNDRQEIVQMSTLKRKKNPAGIIVGVLFWALAPTVAGAALSVSVLEVNPTTAIITNSQQVTITWKVASSDSSFSSGDYRIELGGNGTSGSGTLLQTGTVTVDIQVATTLTASQIGDVNDAYTIFVIVTNGEDATDTNFTAQTVTLYNPPQAPADLSVEAGDTRLMLSWTSSPDNNVDHYNVYYGTISRFDPAFSNYYNGGGTKDSPVNVGNVSSYVLSGLENTITYYVAVETVDTQGAKSDYSDEGSGTPVQTYGLGDISSEKGGCFIATAAFGGEDDPQVQKLRSFRDRVLLPNRLGRFWIHRYYESSPPVARILARSPVLKSVMRSLLGPVVWAARLITPPGDSGRGQSNPE
jgi:hypothetical protein